jgi:hypothetical protein
VGEDHGRDVHAGIKDRLIRIELAIATSKLHGCACEGESERVVAFLGEQFSEETFMEEGFFLIDA